MFPGVGIHAIFLVTVTGICAREQLMALVVPSLKPTFGSSGREGAYSRKIQGISGFYQLNEFLSLQFILTCSP